MLLLKRAIQCAVLLAACGIRLFAQGPGIVVTATLVDGQGNVQTSAYLHFQLWNCGTNVPQIIGNSQAVVAQQFDMRPNPASGLISGVIFGNKQIACGGIQSTQWLVTQYKASNQISGTPQYYVLTSPGTFDPSVNQPTNVIPPVPGFITLFANPLQNQTWAQPASTTGFFTGAFDFSGATVTGLTGGGGGSGTITGATTGGGLVQTATTLGLRNSGLLPGNQNAIYVESNPAQAKHPAFMRCLR